MGFFKDAISSISGGMSGIIGSGLGTLGGLISNDASAEQAHKNREFQRAMSNTAYQRAAKDMEKAGLNRILAVGSPASTPGGAMAQVQNLAESAKSGATSALAVRSANAALKRQEASAGVLDVQRKLDEDMLKLYNDSPEFKKAVLSGRLAKEANVPGWFASSIGGISSAWKKVKNWSTKSFENFGERNSARQYRKMNENVKKALDEIQRNGETTLSGVRLYKDERGRLRFDVEPRDPNWKDKLPVIE